MPITTNANEGSRIQNEAVMLYISTSRLRTRRKLDAGAVQTDVDLEMLHLSKDILKSEALEEIGAFDNAIKRWVRERCLPSPFKGKGVMILPVRLIEQVMNKITEAERDRQPLIDNFIAWYEKQIEPNNLEALKQKLGSGFDINDYPSAANVRSAFRFEMQVWELSTPGKLASINRALYEREVAKMQNVWSEAQKTVSAVLLTEFQKLTAHLAERLQPDDTGKKKTFRDTAVTRLQEWIELFNVRNLTNDDELVALVGKARALINGVDPETIRDADHFRAELAESFTALSKELDATIVNRPARAINLDME